MLQTYADEARAIRVALMDKRLCDDPACLDCQAFLALGERPPRQPFTMPAPIVVAPPVRSRVQALDIAAAYAVEPPASSATEFYRNLSASLGRKFEDISSRCRKMALAPKLLPREERTHRTNEKAGQGKQARVAMKCKRCHEVKPCTSDIASPVFGFCRLCARCEYKRLAKLRRKLAQPASSTGA